MTVVSRFISYAFHPLFMPLYTMVLCLEFDPYLSMFLPYKAKITLYGILIINTIVIPLGTLIYLKRKGLIPSYELKNRTDRTIPFAMTFLYYLLTYVVLRKTGLPDVVFELLLIGVFGTLLVLVVNHFWKISAHAIGVGGLVGAVCGLAIAHNYLNTSLLISAWIIAGLVGTARLYLQAHKPAQVYVGFLLCFFFSFITVACSWYV
jgi:membrane-associated phospholipid phosphatase